MAKAGASKKNQARLPGTEGAAIPAIAEAAARMIDIQGQVKSLKPELKDAEEKVIKVMKENKRDHYLYDGIEVWVEDGKPKAKVKHASTPESDAEQEA